MQVCARVPNERPSLWAGMKQCGHCRGVKPWHRCAGVCAGAERAALPLGRHRRLHHRRRAPRRRRAGAADHGGHRRSQPRPSGAPGHGHHALRGVCHRRRGARAALRRRRRQHRRARPLCCVPSAVSLCVVSLYVARPAVAVRAPFPVSSLRCFSARLSSTSALLCLPCPSCSRATPPATSTCAPPLLCPCCVLFPRACALPALRAARLPCPCCAPFTTKAFDQKQRAARLPWPCCAPFALPPLCVVSRGPCDAPAPGRFCRCATQRQGRADAV